MAPTERLETLPYLPDNSAAFSLAQAKTDCRVAAVDEQRFLDMVAKTPEFSLHVMSVLADRLRGMDKRV